MQIDESDEQERNTNFSIRESFDPASNLTLETDTFPEKQKQPNASIHPGITIAAALPNDAMIDVHPKVTKNSPRILK
jgi:hypothetical protein